MILSTQSAKEKVEWTIEASGSGTGAGRAVAMVAKAIARIEMIVKDFMMGMTV